MKKEPFWSPHVKEAVKKGLEQAIEEGISKRETHKAMSSLLAGEKEWASAISLYRKALRYRAFDNRPKDYIHLGRLYLKNEEIKEAEENFFKALDLSRSKEKDLERLYRLYKGEGSMEELYRFYQQVSRRLILSYRMDILLARSLIDLNQKEPAAEAYYWLARIAQTEKDWDAMELAIQKATVIEPINSQYHLLFSRLLKQIKKLERAEKEAGLAIKHSANPSPWLLNNRAWIRWAQKDYLGAANDWKSAIILSPKRASFYARTAEAYRMLGHWPAAIDYYQKAMKLDPANKHYKKKYRELKASESAEGVADSS